MLGRKKSRTRRRRLEVSAASEQTARQRRPESAENTGRMRPSQAPPRDLSSIGAKLGRRIGVFILAAAIVISLFNVLSVSPRVKVEPLSRSKTSSALLRNSSEYQAAADKLLSSSLWNRNKITINTGQVSRQLIKQFPELSGASITLPLLAHRPILYVQPAEASLVVAAANGAFVVDQDGRALMPSSNLPTAHNLPQVVDKSGLSVSIGHQVLTGDDVNFIQTVLAELKAKHIQVSSMVLPAESRELDVYIEKQPYFVKFNLAGGDARQQAGTYLATVAELKREHASAAHYIDVRVDGRAYYK